MDVGFAIGFVTDSEVSVSDRTECGVDFPGVGFDGVLLSYSVACWGPGWSAEVSSVCGADLNVVDVYGVMLSVEMSGSLLGAVEVTAWCSSVVGVDF